MRIWKSLSKLSYWKAAGIILIIGTLVYKTA